MEKKENTTKKNKKNVSASAKKGTQTKKVTTSKTSTNNTKVETKKETPKTEVTSKIEEKKKNVAPVTTKTNHEEEPEFAGSEIRKLLIIIGAVCAVMLSFYFITEFVIKNKKEDETKQETKIDPQIQYEEILMGSALNQGSGEYYVLAYVKDDKMLDVYNEYIKTYNEKENHMKFYKVNLSNDFNKVYVAEEAFLEGNDITKVRVTGTTLIKVIDNSVAYSYRESDKIIDKIKRLIG